METQLSLFSPETTLVLSWRDLFRPEMTPEERKKRWEVWKTVALQQDRKEMVKLWDSCKGCDGCMHLQGTWCDLQGLPCSVNPILTFRYGIIGMACMGAGYETMTTQKGTE